MSAASAYAVAATANGARVDSHDVLLRGSCQRCG